MTTTETHEYDLSAEDIQNYNHRQEASWLPDTDGTFDLHLTSAEYKPSDGTSFPMYFFTFKLLGFNCPNTIVNETLVPGGSLMKICHKIETMGLEDWKRKSRALKERGLLFALHGKDFQEAASYGELRNQLVAASDAGVLEQMFETGEIKDIRISQVRKELKESRELRKVKPDAPIKYAKIPAQTFMSL